MPSRTGFHVDSGDVGGVDVSGLTVAVLADAPPLMGEGNWRVGVLMDAAASQEQAEALSAVFSGQRGGRSPLGFLLHFGNYRGRLRDLRVGFYHGAYCVGCCWGLMVVLITVGVMNLQWMVGLATVIFIEKTWRYGKAFSAAFGIALIAFACFVPWHASLVPGLYMTGNM